MKEKDALHIKLAHQVGGAIACLLALALLLGLTACGKGQAQQPQSKPSAEADDQPDVQEPELDVIYDLLAPVDSEAGEDDGFPEPEEDDEPAVWELSFTQEEYDQLVADTLESLVSDDMTPMEQAKAVFDYVHANIRYTGTSDKSDWMNGAYIGLSTGRGDCFTYYAVSRALLTALGIDNLEVQRKEGYSTSHYWNLVNCGDGWYHFDACPRSVKMPIFLSFMVTDEQIAAFTAMAGRYYYDFDDTLLPERATEIVTNTHPIPRPPVEEEDEEEPLEEDYPEVLLPDEPELPPDDSEGEPGNTAEPPADWSAPGTSANNAGDSGDPETDMPTEIWTEPSVEEWPEPALDGGTDGYGEMEAA